MSAQPTILVTGATGQLGRLVISSLLSASVPASSIAALVRDKAKAADLAALGVTIRVGDYGKPETLAAAFAGIKRLLLISSSEIGQRAAQHRNAIDAAKKAGVSLIAYTSLLHAPRTPLGLATEHRQTEAMLAESGVPFVVLRNGWYSENYAGSIPSALAHNTLFGCAGNGRISSAARADYAAAAAAVLQANDQAGKVYELAGDEAYTLTQFAAELSRQTQKTIAYQDLPEADYRAALVGAGLPAPIADLLSDSDKGAASDALFDDSRQLSRLIGRPTTPIKTTIQKALSK